MAHGAALGTMLGALALGTACGATPDDENTVVEVVNWWSSGGEKEALDALIAVHQRRHPEASVVNAVHPDSAAARSRIDDRMLRLAPPDSYQANVGLDLLRWVLVNGVNDDESKLRPLRPLPIAGVRDWSEVFPEAVTERLGVDGEVYGVPVNIHRINTLHYHRGVLADHGLEPPASLEELYAVMDVIIAANAERSADQQIIPLAVGGKDTWAVSALFFENLLLATAGVEFFLSYFQGHERADAQPMLDTLDEAKALWTRVRVGDPDVLERSWTEAVALVASGDAAMTVMGDWTKGSLRAAGLEPGVDFGTVPFPGSAPAFVFTSDAFAAPKGAENAAAAQAWLETVASAEGQAAFNPIKGSIPARTRDVDLDAYDALARQTIEDFMAGPLAPALSALTPSAWSDPMNQRLGEFVASDPLDVDLMRFTLTNYYDLLKE
ncbi:MAG TPA: ABC transporter substrate-binding protein [Polyangiaceae bacterium]|nr:ABC transporter substrate-binding protein [Polyangiaceae bacterium]